MAGFIEELLKSSVFYGASNAVVDLGKFPLWKAKQKKAMKTHVVDWNGVSSAIDFVSFWTMLVFEVLAITIFVTLINSAHG